MRVWCPGQDFQTVPPDYLKSITFFSLCRFALFLLSPSLVPPHLVPRAAAPVAYPSIHHCGFVPWDLGGSVNRGLRPPGTPSPIRPKQHRRKTSLSCRRRTARRAASRVADVLQTKVDDRTKSTTLSTVSRTQFSWLLIVFEAIQFNKALLNVLTQLTYLFTYLLVSGR